MDEIVRVGAVARIDPDASRELAEWEADLSVGSIDDPEETRRRLDAYARGEQVIVRLDMFADVLREGAVERYDGAWVHGAWFEAGADEANRAHARELVVQNLEEFHRELTDDHGLEVSYETVSEIPVRIEIDDALAHRLG